MGTRKCYLQVETIENSKVKNVPCQYAHMHTTTYASTHTETNTHTYTDHTYTHRCTHTWRHNTQAHRDREKCTFYLNSLLDHTANETKKHRYTCSGRWHWIKDKNHKQTASSPVYLHCSLLGHCCHSKEENKLSLHGLSVLISKVECCPPAHEVKEAQRNLLGRTHLRVPHQLVYLCRQHPTVGVLPQEFVNNTQNEDVSTTQVQMSMSSVAMQQMWPERSQNASHKQTTM